MDNLQIKRLSEKNKLPLFLIGLLINYSFAILRSFRTCLYLAIWFYINRFIFIMQISIFAKAVFFLTLYAISDLSIKNYILKKTIRRANRAKSIF